MIFRTFISSLFVRALLYSSIVAILFYPGKNDYPFLVFLHTRDIQSNINQMEGQSYFHGVAGAITGLLAYRRYGEFIIPPRANLLEVFQIIFLNRKYKRKLHVLSGITTREFLRQLNLTHGLHGKVPERFKDEGIFLSDTYHYVFGDKKCVLLKYIALNLEKVKKKLWAKYRDTTQLENIDQAIVLASIVANESEREEFEHIAAVFLNRLYKNMRLQADSTVIYLKDMLLDKHVDRVNFKDLFIESPYNSYRNKGLPPAPIGNTCEHCLEGVLKAKKSDKLFFVVDPKRPGYHIFTSKFDDHINHANKYRNHIRKKS